MEKIVTNCKDCVFNTYGKDDTPYCKLDEDCRDLITDKTGYYATDEMPEWCPIKSGGILIKLKQANVSGQVCGHGEVDTIEGIIFCKKCKETLGGGM